VAFEIDEPSMQIPANNEKFEDRVFTRSRNASNIRITVRRAVGGKIREERPCGHPVCL
jgi:hypothetical protein